MEKDLPGRGRKQPDFDALLAQFRAPGIAALVLMGSYARGDAGPFSDVDLVRFHAQDAPSASAETHFLGGHFVVVSDAYPDQIEEWFQKPELASTTIAGLRSARPLWDPDDFFATIQARAKAFRWDAEMQARANAWASSQMVGWIEEAQKGLAGLQIGHEGRLLNARYGLTWGMVNVLRVQRGILVSGDNGVYPEVIRAMGVKSLWAALSRQAYGMDGDAGLPEQVVAGLRLYAHTAELLAAILTPDDKLMVDQIVQRIMAQLPATGFSEGG
jgi:hypothetical protein